MTTKKSIPPRKSLAIRISCTQTFYERANRVAEAKWMSLSEFSKLAIENQIMFFEEHSKSINTVTIV